MAETSQVKARNLHPGSADGATSEEDGMIGALGLTVDPPGWFTSDPEGVAASALHLSDRRLMQRVAANDLEARRVLARRLLPLARRVARSLLRQRADAEDAVQTALIEILRSAATYRGETAIERWAQRIVVRTSLRYAREQRRHSRIAEASAEIDQLHGHFTEVPPGGAEEALPRPVLEYLERISQVQRDAVVLRHALGLSVAEIAEVTGVSENTAKARLLYGRRALRRLVRRDLKLGAGASEEGNRS
jgi:RNA polymerase sigma-70 factor (ECF subfamily)